MNLRIATHRDEDAIFGLLLYMHAEVGLASLNEAKVRGRIRHVLTNGRAFLVEDEGNLVGSIGCVPDSFWYSAAVELFDAWLYVMPEARASRAAAALIEAYKDEAARRGFPKPYLGRMNVIDAERKDVFFRRHGFEPVGSLFRLKDTPLDPVLRRHDREDAHVLR